MSTASPEIGPRAPGGDRLTLAITGGLFATAVLGRLAMFRAGLGGDALPAGPDAEDWVIAAAGIADGDWSLLQPNRYPLFPLLASLPIRFGISPSGALMALSLVFSALTAPVVFLLGRRWLSPWAAAAAGAWVALAPSQLFLGVCTIAYTLFGLAFAVALLGLLDDHRWRGPLLVGLGSAVAVATLNQGLLCLLAMLPAGLLLRRWFGVGAGLAGAAVGLGIVHGLHPNPTSATSWMLRESMKYLSGNIPEETARAGGGYWDAFSFWTDQTFRLGGIWVVLLLGLGVWGIAVALWRAHQDGRPLVPTLALAWALAPSIVLVVAMGSGHHLIHLIPLLALAATLGGAALAPGLYGRIAGAATAIGVAALCVTSVPSTVRDLENRAREGRNALEVADGVRELVGEDGVVVTPPTRPGDPAEIVFNVQWAFPAGVTVIQLGDLNNPHPIPPLEEALTRGATVAVVGGLADTTWAAGPYTYTATGASVPLPGRPHDTPQAMHVVAVTRR